VQANQQAIAIHKLKKKKKQCLKLVSRSNNVLGKASEVQENGYPNSGLLTKKKLKAKERLETHLLERKARPYMRG